MDKLKKCPFCGKTRPVKLMDSNEVEGIPVESERYNPNAYFTVVCAVGYTKNTGCGGASGYAKTKEETVAKWNMREGK